MLAALDILADVATEEYHYEHRLWQDSDMSPQIRRQTVAYLWVAAVNHLQTKYGMATSAQQQGVIHQFMVRSEACIFDTAKTRSKYMDRKANKAWVRKALDNFLQKKKGIVPV